MFETFVVRRNSCASFLIEFCENSGENWCEKQKFEGKTSVVMVYDIVLRNFCFVISFFASVI